MLCTHHINCYSFQVKSWCCNKRSVLQDGSWRTCRGGIEWGRGQDSPGVALLDSWTEWALSWKSPWQSFCRRPGQGHSTRTEKVLHVWEQWREKSSHPRYWLGQEHTGSCPLCGRQSSRSASFGGDEDAVGSEPSRCLWLPWWHVHTAYPPPTQTWSHTGWEDVARSVVSLGTLIPPASRLQMVSLPFPQQ